MLIRSAVSLAIALTCALAAPGQAPPTFSVQFKELESYKKAGREWRSVVVDRKIKRDDLVRLARELHAAFPGARFHVLTDDEKFPEFMRSDIHSGDPAHAYPEEWAKKHYVATINSIWRRDGQRWVLYPAGPAGKKFVPKGETAIAEL